MKLPKAGPVVEMLLGATMISTSAVWVRVADVSPTTAGFYRMVFGAIALAVVLAASGRWPSRRDARQALGLLPVAAFFALDLFLWHRSIHYVGPGLATVLANLQVFVLAAAGVLFFGERIGWRFPVGLALALPGLLVLVGVDFADLPANYLRGVAYGVGTAFAYAGYLLGLRSRQSNARTLHPAVNLLFVSLWVALLLGTVVVLMGEGFAIPNTHTALALGVYGVVCQALGWVLMTRAMPQLPASVLGLLLLLQPALAMVWDIVFFGRPFGWSDMGAGVLVLAGIYLAVRRNKRKALTSPRDASP